MAKLTIKNFSCIREAAVQLNGMTIITGPQASGKSLISKLCYFFFDILDTHHTAIRERQPIGLYRLELVDLFRKRFPPESWGSEYFTISFEAGPFRVEIKRSRTKPPSAGVRITLSKFFLEHYQAVLKASQTLTSRDRTDDSRATAKEFQFYFRIRDASKRSLETGLGPEFIGFQLFIPAGRA